jgi:hypothetical protein
MKQPTDREVLDAFERAFTEAVKIAERRKEETEERKRQEMLGLFHESRQTNVDN